MSQNDPILPNSASAGSTSRQKESSNASDWRISRKDSRSDDDDDDDIFGRTAKSDVLRKEKEEEANAAYQRMMSTMKSESSTSKAVNTNKALDSSSEDELENAIQKAVMGSKAKGTYQLPSFNFL